MTAPVSSDLAWLDDLQRAHATATTLPQLGDDESWKRLEQARYDVIRTVPQLVAAVRAVLDVHQPFTDAYGATRPWCQHDPDDSWPCPTVKAISAALSPAEVTR